MVEEFELTEDIDHEPALYLARGEKKKRRTGGGRGSGRGEKTSVKAGFQDKVGTKG